MTQAHDIVPLASDRPRRTWSLIVTVMGDLTRETGTPLDGPLLRAILGRLGSNDQAVRTALHRLRADGWIETERDGRISRHRLSARALTETRAAAPRIYGPGPTQPKVWSLVMAEECTDAVATLAPGVHLRPGLLGDDPGLEGERLCLSEAQRAVLWPAPLRTECRTLLAQLGDLSPLGEATPEAVAARRALLVHDWRRIVLRMPDIPDSYAPEDWVGAETRSRVHAMLTDLPVPAVNDPDRS